jgi:hypothetical protein
MKESWYYYDYLFRWGRLLLLGFLLGALAGLGYYLQQDFKGVDYKGTAILTLADAKDILVITTARGTQDTRSEEAVAETINTIAGDIHRSWKRVTGISAIRVDPVHQPNTWKPIVMGSIIGGLLMISIVYVWEDVARYVRSRRKVPDADA